MRRGIAIFCFAGTLSITVALPATSGDAMVVERDVVFVERERGGLPLALDVYSPSGGTGHPAVIAIHGGGWHQGDKSRWETSAPDLVSAGFVVFSVNYRLAEDGYPTYIKSPRDIWSAIAWVREHGKKYDADPGAVSLIGSSAGAHLALVAGQRQGYPKIRAVAAWSPPLNLRGLAKRGVVRGALRKFLGCSPDECPPRYKRMSPLHGVERSDPPAFLANSTDEIIPLYQTKLMAEELDERSIDHEVVKVRGEAHGQGLKGAVIDDTIAFLSEHATPSD